MAEILGLGGVGDDDAGRYLLQIFRHEQIETSQVQILQQASTAFSLVLVHETFGRRTILHHRGVQAQADLSVPQVELAGVRFLHQSPYLKKPCGFSKSKELRSISAWKALFSIFLKKCLTGIVCSCTMLSLLRMVSSANMTNSPIIQTICVTERIMVS
jgi:hypothetical protein